MAHKEYQSEDFARTFKRGFLDGAVDLTITSDFGWRIHPTRKELQFHNGVDLRCPEGSNLHAPVNMYYLGHQIKKNGGGLILNFQFSLDHGNLHPIFISFMHMHSMSEKLKAGESVAEGTYIGKTGGGVTDAPYCGASNGAHLHIQIMVNSLSFLNAIDPKPFLLQHRYNVIKTHEIKVGNTDNVWLSDEEIIKKQQAEETPYNSLQDTTLDNETEFEKPKPKRITSVSKRFAPGIWQITKLAVDSSVEGRQVVSTGIATSTGSLMNFFRTVCQEPLVEFSGDTFGSQYFWLVRRPPFNKTAWNKMKDTVMTDIENSQIISMSVGWNTQDIYSWYQYIPFYDIFGAKEATMIMPAIFFPEYAQIWGSRPLSIQSNYYSYLKSGYFGKENKEVNKSNGNEISKNVVRDLAYIIESYAYTPFVRSGSITIQGDRRIKRGTLVRVSQTNEIYYVDSVSNSLDTSLSGVNRTTTIQISRGMFDVGSEKYFNLIDWGGYKSVDEMVDNVTANNITEIISKWKVNQDVFVYLLSHKQGVKAF